MNYVNPPAESPENVTHKTFFSQVLNHEIGYNIYLPPGYKDNCGKYPVVYHIHGWMGNESSEIWPLEKVYSNRQAITVFVNAKSSEDIYFSALMQIESIIIKELIPYIDGHYRTDATFESRMLSGFSMGGNMAFYYAVKHPELFGSVTAYAGTYHHLFHKEYRTVGVAPEKAGELYEEMLREKWYLEENNILCLVRENADKIRGKLKIALHIGTVDILFCDNEIMHLYLDSLNIPHEYKQFEGVAHELGKIL
jgi:enterochelin esterase-like enzyme